MVLCALAGITTAVGIRHYRRPDTRESGLEVERSILTKCIEHLEQPEYAVEKNILYEKYRSRLEHVNGTLSGKKTTPDVATKKEPKTESRSSSKEVAVGSKDQKTEIKDPIPDKDVKTVKVDTDTTPAGKDTPVRPPKEELKGKSQVKKKGSKPAGKDTRARRPPAPKAPVHDTSPKQAPKSVAQTGKRPAPEPVDVKDAKPEKVKETKERQASKSQSTDNVEVQEDLEKIKNDIHRALSKLEQVEAD